MPPLNPPNGLENLMKYGSMKWKDIVMQVSNLARDGFAVPLNLAKRLQVWKSYILANPILSEIYAPNGKLLEQGETCFRIKYADFLDKLAIEGIDAFYSGIFAQSIIDTIQANGGVVTLADLSSYRPVIRRPLYGTYRGLKVVTGPGL